MNLPKIYHLVRYWLIIIGSMGAGIFWGTLGAGLGRWLFDLEEETALLLIGLPIFIVGIPISIFILPKHLRKAGIL
jgi:hypothetical protein